MNENLSQYRSGLESIARYRVINRRNTTYALLLCIASGFIAPLFPPALFVQILAIGLYIYSQLKMSKVLCPRCLQTFAKKYLLPIGTGPGECKHCGLSMWSLDDEFDHEE